MTCTVRQAGPRDRAWIETQMRQYWGGLVIWSRGVPHNVLECPTLIAETEGAPCGLLAYLPSPPECEIIVVDARPQFRGTGSKLIEAVVARARDVRCSRLWLVTTNDNVDALRFYQRRGFVLSRLYRGVVDEARKLKPTIPVIGCYGIAIHDEIEAERPV